MIICIYVSMIIELVRTLTDYRESLHGLTHSHRGGATYPSVLKGSS